MISNQLSMMLLLAIAISILTVAYGVGVELDPTKPNVCPYETYENGYVTANYSYECYKRQEVSAPCPHGFLPYPEYGRESFHYLRRRGHDWIMRHLWKRQTSMCYRRYETICYKSVINCKPRVVIKHYCCNGTVPDGKGGCMASVKCNAANGGCEQMCVSDDTTGHHCACFEGYQLEGATKCVDIDECALNKGGCDQNCTNTPGSFHCTCRNGYVLDTPLTCAAKNECLIGNGECEQYCTDTDESYYCTCDEGFTLVGRHQCEDENECNDTIVKNGGCSHTCNNVYGDYYCSCPEGYSLDEQGFHCVPGLGGTPALGEEPLTVARAVVRPIVLGPIIGGVLFIVLLVIIALCCFRLSKKRSAAAAGIVVFPVAKKKKMYVEDGFEPGNEKVTMEPSGNIYSPPPAKDNPPAYEEVIIKQGKTAATFEQQSGEEESPMAYENVMFSSKPGYEEPKVVPTTEPDTYENLGYESEVSKPINLRDAKTENSLADNEDPETPMPFAEARNNLRKTGVLPK